MILKDIIIDYGDLSIYHKFELDKKAYQIYFNEHAKYVEFHDDCSILTDTIDHMSFNEWYGTEEHLIYILPLLDNSWAKKELRKMKLIKINNILIS